MRLKKDAKPGYLHDPLILVTNDPDVPQFPIEVEGVVKAELNVSPQVLTMGTLDPGTQVVKPLIITGHKPFKIAAVHCDDDAFSFRIPTGAEKVRMIAVTFTAPNKPGKLLKKIKIETDLGKTLTLEVLAEANINAAPPAAPPASSTTTTHPKAGSTAPVTKTPPVLKLDTGNGTAGGSANAGSANSGASTGSSSPNTHPDVPAAVTPAEVKPTSVMPNPIRTKTAPPASGSAAAN